MALLVVKLLFSIHISLTFHIELLLGASELLWCFEYVDRFDVRAASLVLSVLSYSY